MTNRELAEQIVKEIWALREKGIVITDENDPRLDGIAERIAAGFRQDDGFFSEFISCALASGIKINPETLSQLHVQHQQQSGFIN